MSMLSDKHRATDSMGFGLCSVPMWNGGCPSGFCDRQAYGERPHSPMVMNYSAGRMVRRDRKYDGYVPGLACPHHGGPTSRVFMDGDSWCAVRGDFINLQESISGWGKSPDEARADLARVERAAP